MTHGPLGPLPLVVRAHIIGGRTYRIAAVEDQDALLQGTAHRDLLPFGLMLWESAVALAEVVAASTVDWPSLRVVDLGAGVGLPGIVASALGADVTALDIDPLACELARDNARRNGCARRYAAHVANWHDAAPAVQGDIVLGADIAYDADDHAALVHWLGRVVAPGGKALLTDPQRPMQKTLVQRLEASGFRVGIGTIDTADLTRPGRTVAISVLTVDRGTGDPATMLPTSAKAR